MKWTFVARYKRLPRVTYDRRLEFISSCLQFFERIILGRIVYKRDQPNHRDDGNSRSFGKWAERKQYMYKQSSYDC